MPFLSRLPVAALLLSTLAPLCSQAFSELKIKKQNLALAKSAVASYADLAFEMNGEAVKSAKELQSVVKAFTQNPNDATLTAAKNAWINARKFYSNTEALRFYGGPIDNAENGPEGLLNAWPLDESYIDYVKGNPKAGIVQNPEKFPTINKELLLSLNEKDGEKNISTGYHAIEFLLWGQDFSTTGAGKRSPHDYEVKSAAPAAKYAARRATYLNLLCDILVEHLEQVTAQWNPKTKNSYRQAFLKEPTAESLRKIFVGITSLSVDEMGGERLTVALEIHDQENEQDCFSDNSLVDTMHNQRGIEMVLNNKGRANSLLNLIEAEQPALAKEVSADIAQSIEIDQKLIDAKVPFDQIVAQKSEDSKGRKQVRALIAALDAQSVSIAKAGKAMGLELNIETEEAHN